jgi:hypothetical protein
MVTPYHSFTFSQQYLWLWFIIKSVENWSNKTDTWKAYVQIPWAGEVRLDLPLYPEIYPKSANFFCLSHYRPMLWNWKYSCLCAVYIGHRRRNWSFPTEIRLDYVFGKCCESCWFAFNKSSHIWKIGQKIAPILESLPQEKTETTRKLINSSCSKLNKQDIFIDYQPHK